MELPTIFRVARRHPASTVGAIPRSVRESHSPDPSMHFFARSGFGPRRFAVGSELARATRQGASKLAGLRNSEFWGGLLLSIAKRSDVGCRPRRSGFTPDIPGKPVGDKPRPTVGPRHAISRKSVIPSDRSFHKPLIFANFR